MSGMARKKENTIRKTTGKGGNYRKTKAGAGMTKKGVAAYRKKNPFAYQIQFTIWL